MRPEFVNYLPSAEQPIESLRRRSMLRHPPPDMRANSQREVHTASAFSLGISPFG
jgi:hypothetical protein